MSGGIKLTILLWRKHRPEELASVHALHHNPLLFYEFYGFRLQTPAIRRVLSSLDS